jgi:hypothetical protein
MKSPIINGVSQAGLEQYLAARQYNELYWASLFPPKNVNSLDGKTIIGASGNRVAANIISYDASTPELGRKSLSVKYFDIPKVAIARRKSEREILEHQITRNIQGNVAVIEDYFNDLDFCWDGVQARMEWLALQALSATTLTLSTTNNPLGVINETAIDFGMPSANKKVVTTAKWSTANAASMIPITDFKKMVGYGRAIGVNLRYALMNATTFDFITGSTEYQNAAKQFLVGEPTVLGYQSLEIANRVMNALRLPQIVLIDTYVGIENAAGTVTATDPWSASHVTFLPDLVVGNFYAGPIAEEIERPLDVIQSKRGPVLLSVRKDFNPSSVITKGEANVFPSWANVDQCFSLYTGDTSTWA